jgi:predicted GH43/DUF377 family glycosyl hydrolase
MGVIMSPDSGNPMEAEGVLNPAATRGPDGHLYLFPRLVARGNYSRIGIARVVFDGKGDPSDVERLGVVLEPSAEYERRPDGSGGCEDPRITFVEPLKCYVMTYTAFSSAGPRIAIATSTDLFHWERLGLATFASSHGVDFVHVDNKDASVFPRAIPNHDGQMEMGLLHRPLFPGTRPEEIAGDPSRQEIDIDRESIWISYAPMTTPSGTPRIGLFNSHHRLASPVAPWEALKIGGGTPPILTPHGWLIVYHGVGPVSSADADAQQLCYSAGMMILSETHPQVIRYRASDPVLTPTRADEKCGTVPNVVFPTGIDRRDDLGTPHRLDVYYGMADFRIGVARLDLPEVLPHDGVAHAPPAAVAASAEPDAGLTGI